MAYWPGYDIPPPVILPGVRPGRNRPRQASAHLTTHAPYYVGPSGELLVPGVPERRQRSSSTSGFAPAPQVTIINDGPSASWDNHSPSRRPRSSHGGYIEEDYVLSRIERLERSHSRSRRRESRSPSPPRRRRSHHHKEPLALDLETQKQLAKLHELEREEEERRHKQQLHDELLVQQAKEKMEAEKKKKEEEEFKKAAIADWEKKEKERKEKEAREKEEADKEYDERMRKTLLRNGYSYDQIEKIMRKGEKGKGEGSKGKEPGNMLSLGRPTHIKVARRHLDPETLDLYQLPWEWDEEDSRYIIIKQWIPEHEQDILFEHTRHLRDNKLLVDTETVLKKDREKLLLVRKKAKSPARNWFLT
ncbi:MAG: hypothetical protein MMC33_010429 [Icmadophila ericetorum]|nr:hypothetical protein [Icmadophila ericetorum]